MTLVTRAQWLCCLLLACSSDKSPATGAGPGGKRPAAPVTTAIVATADVPVDIDAIGHVEASQTVSLSSRIGGQLVAVHFTEGDLVSAGQVLFTIDDRPYKIALDAARARLARDLALYRAAGRNLARQDQLAAGELTSKAEVDTASTSVSSARATIAADQADVADAELQLAYCVISSPIAGRTGAILVHAGNLVRANDTQALVTIRQTDPVRVQVSLPERYLPRLRERDKHSGDTAPLTLEATPDGEHASPAHGTLALVDNAIDETTGTISIFGTFPNADNKLWPGQFVKTRVRLAVDKAQVVVAARAVQDGQKGDFVYLVEDHKAKVQPVEVLRIQDDVAIIAKGLTPGQVVVTDGQMRLAPGVEVVITVPKDAGATPTSPTPTRSAP